MNLTKIIILLYCFSLFSHEQEKYNPELKFRKKITVIGTGYVGLVLGACLADFGHKVICCDIDEKKIHNLQQSIIPIYEPGLDELVSQVTKTAKLAFTTDVDTAIKESQIIFIAVNTPMDEGGKANISAVIKVAKQIGKNLNDYKVICMKSTVPLGTSNLIKQVIKENCSHEMDFDVVTNSEFLREGTAVEDFIKPDRVVIGAESEKAFNIMKEIYFPFVKRNVPFVLTNLISAETIKYASNAFLAVKISFINEMAKLCDITKANINAVAIGMGLDPRIGPDFLKAGPGFGGSCFPKDTQALLYTAACNNLDLKIIKAAIEVNNEQSDYIFGKILDLFENNIKDKKFAILGLAFKANTDDVRYSPAISIIKKLQSHGAHVSAYDPAAMENMMRELDNVTYCNTSYDAIINADCLILLTEWQEFKELNWQEIKNLMKQPYIVDARNIVDTEILNNLNFKYYNIGNFKKINFT